MAGMLNKLSPAPVLETIDWAAISAFDAAALCCVEADIAGALVLSQMIPAKRMIRDHEVVYVIGDEEGRTKIGIAGCPKRRLAALQGSNGSRLTVRALFWVYGRAIEIEQPALRQARADGRGLMGEWTSRDWLSSALIVAECAKEIGAATASSAMWFANRHAIDVANRAAKLSLRDHDKESSINFNMTQFEKFTGHTPIYK